VATVQNPHLKGRAATEVRAAVLYLATRLLAVRYG
jgi:hypothetical protein